MNNVIKGKLLESAKLMQQASNNTKEQFANSRDLKAELVGCHKTLVAIANKNVRQIWALLAKGEIYDLKDLRPECVAAIRHRRCVLS